MNINISASNSRIGCVFSPLVLIEACFDARLSGKKSLSTEILKMYLLIFSLQVNAGIVICYAITAQSMRILFLFEYMKLQSLLISIPWCHAFRDACLGFHLKFAMANLQVASRWRLAFQGRTGSILARPSTKPSSSALNFGSKQNRRCGR
jgi:hypothetical protein